MYVINNVGKIQGHLSETSLWLAFGCFPQVLFLRESISWAPFCALESDLNFLHQWTRGEITGSTIDCPLPCIHALFTMWLCWSSHQEVESISLPTPPPPAPRVWAGSDWCWPWECGKVMRMLTLRSVTLWELWAWTSPGLELPLSL